MAFHEVPIESLEFNPFKKISKQWMLITAGDEKKSNTMTASWGGLGIMWGKNVATAYIRPNRYTKEFVDQTDHFTLSFLPEEERKALNLYHQEMKPECFDAPENDERWYPEKDYHIMYMAEIEKVLVK